MRHVHVAVLLLVGMALGAILTVVLHDLTRPLSEYAQDKVCRSVCMSCGECLSHRSIKLRIDRPTSKRTNQPSSRPKIIPRDTCIPGTPECEKEKSQGNSEAQHKLLPLSSYGRPATLRYISLFNGGN